MRDGGERIAPLAAPRGAIVAAAFTYLNVLGQWLFRHLGPTLRPVLGGLALGLLAFWSPYALTFGEAQINGLAARHAIVSVLIVAALAKLVGTTVTNTSGWRGGFIIPLFFIGVSLGRLLHVYVPHTNEAVLIAAFMAAANTGVTKTPIGSTLVVTEMAGLHLEVAPLNEDDAEELGQALWGKMMRQRRAIPSPRPR